MSIKKKVVWLPYDMDTAIGINNDGELVFDYMLEDIDTQQGGEGIFNGQDSVIWKNVRAAFANELKTMYQNLRSSGALSYDKIEKMFEEHQEKWAESIFNEDARFKYIDPFINDNANYLYMLLGSKEEQRKWWLYNRFRYIDSKYIAGDARTDTIFLRPYAAEDITLTPYADIYATIAWDATITQERAERNKPIKLDCPYQTMNGNIVTIYSASQLASIGDISGLKVGQVDISNATRLQSLKVGDSSAEYSNSNLYSMTFGSNVLLRTVDVRNCVGLGDTTIQGHTQTTVDLSGCSILEHVYFDGTKITGISLPNGGVLKTLSLPATVTNLTVLNQPSITNFSMGGTDYSNISTLRIENCSSAIPVLDILEDMAANSRVRIIGFTMAVQSTTDVEDFFDYLDTMRGLDEQGNNLDHAVVAGTITGLGTITGEWLAQMNARYPNVNIEYEHISSKLFYYNGETLYYTETITDGGNGTYSGTPTKSATAQYTYAFAGWSKDSDDNTVDADARTAVVADRNIYACYTATVRTYTVIWKNADGTTLETDNNVPYGSTPQYNGSTPTYDGQTSTGWNPTPSSVTGNVTYTATYLPVYTVTFMNDTGSTTLDTQRVVQGGTATYGGTTPTSSEDASLTWLGWATSANSHTADAVLTNIQSSMTVYAAFESAVEVAEITDAWDQIIANIDNGTYSTKYKIGNYKPLDLGTEGTINMQIVAMDADELADGSGYAPLSFVAMELLNTTKYFKNSSGYTTDAWETSLIKPFLSDTVLPLIKTASSAVASRIQTVIKHEMNFTENSGTVEIATNEKLFIPSYREMVASDSVEENGPKYYRDGLTRIRKRNGTATKYWTRSVQSYQTIFAIETNGAAGNSKMDFNRGICLGFCLGLETETIEDDWATILANQNYATDYSIGDTKMLDLGTEGKHLMEIVAFDTDDRADGQGKAGITWISKDLLKTKHNMTSSGNTTGGWEQSGMRDYLENAIKPLIPTTLKNAIVEVTKISSTYENGALVKDGQTTTDDLWIPSNREVTNSSDYETQGPAYTAKFNPYDGSSRIKKLNAVDQGWYLRSVATADMFLVVSSSYGRIDNIDAWRIYGVALGFCTN